jgi:hypothetical protein
VQKSAKAPDSPGLLQTYENLVRLRVAKLRNFGKRAKTDSSTLGLPGSPAFSAF